MLWAQQLILWGYGMILIKIVAELKVSRYVMAVHNSWNANWNDLNGIGIFLDTYSELFPHQETLSNSVFQQKYCNFPRLLAWQLYLHGNRNLFLISMRELYWKRPVYRRLYIYYCFLPRQPFDNDIALLHKWILARGKEKK